MTKPSVLSLLLCIGFLPGIFAQMLKQSPLIFPRISAQSVEKYYR